MKYAIHVRPESGEIAGIEKNCFNNKTGLIGYQVTDEYLDLISDFSNGIKKTRHYRVDLQSEVLKILKLEDIIVDPTNGKFVNVSFADHSYSFLEGFLLEIFTKENRPYISISYKGSLALLNNYRSKKIKFYATHYNDLTLLYEEFIFDKDSLLLGQQEFLPITSIDTEKLLSWNFSIFTRKIAKLNTCKFEWPHPSYIRLRE
jgi:hypothetical protein